MIQVNAISKIIDNEPILDNVTFELPTDGLLLLKGRSGSGKSTLLAIMGTLLKPTNGEIIINSIDVTKKTIFNSAAFRSEHIGFVYQDYALIDELSLYQNLYLATLKKSIPHSAIILHLEKFGLSTLMRHTTSTLSGGQKQRLAIARATLFDPPILMLDEPTANLDHANANLILELVRNRNAQARTTIIATHDTLFDQDAHLIVTLDGGKIV